MHARHAQAGRPSRVALAAMLAVMLLVPATARAARKALVIGVSAYDSWTPLKNPRNDAEDVAAELTKLGFVVTTLKDPGKADLDGTLESWASSLAGDDTAVLFFAGHGFQIQASDVPAGSQGLVGNYLVPRDMPEHGAMHISAVGEHALPLGRVQNRLRFASPKALVVILDACRNNPWAAARGGSLGLAAVSPSGGELYAFATAAGATASDNAGGRNGLFTQMLLRELRQDDQDVESLLVDVGQAVYVASGQRQRPWRSSGLVGRVWLGAARSGSATTATAAAPPTPAPTGPADDRGAGPEPDLREACPVPGYLLAGGGEMAGALACMFPVAEPPAGSHDVCDLAGGVVGYTWTSVEPGPAVCEEGFTAGRRDGNPFCSVAIAPPPGSMAQCNAPLTTPGAVAYVWPSEQSPPELAPLLRSAEGCPGVALAFAGMVSCMLTDVWLPAGAELECGADWAGFRPATGQDLQGNALCPTGMVPADWADGSVGCMVDMPSAPGELACTHDDGLLTVSWWP